MICIRAGGFVKEVFALNGFNGICQQRHIRKPPSALARRRAREIVMEPGNNDS